MSAPTEAPPIISSAPQKEFKAGLGPLLGTMALYGGSPIILLQTAGIFIAPTAAATGLPTSAISIGPIILLVLALSQPLVGILLTRWGPRPLAVTAMVSMLVGMAMLTLLPASQLTFYGVGILLGIGGGLGFTATVSKFLSLWFRRNYGFAIGLVGGMASVIPLAAVPIIAFVIYASGDWRTGYFVLMGFVALICLPLVLWGVREPSEEKPAAFQVEEAQDGTNKEATGATLLQAMRDMRFWCLLLTFFAVTFAVGGFAASLQPMLLNQGIPVAIATGTSMALLVGTLAGRVLGGFLLDRIPPYLVPLIVLSLSGVAAIFVARVDSTVGAVVLAVTVFFLGLSTGAEADFPAFFLLREFGSKHFSVIAGVTFMVFGVSGSIGGLVFAAVRDATGDYASVASLASLGYFFGAALMLACGWLSRRKAKAGVLAE